LVGNDHEGAATAAEIASLEAGIHPDQGDVDRSLGEGGDRLAELRQRLLDDRERLVDRAARALAGGYQGRGLRQRVLDTRQERRRAALLGAEQRAAVTDDASRIIQDRRQSANDLADVAAELALGVPELGCLQLADRTRAV